ncbi:MAG: copper homeostasis protein CutC [Bacteroidota bacterium]
MKNLKIEVCAASVQSAINAQKAGAHRIELCGALELGGLTPSASAILLARALVDIDIFVLIRPRPGDFHYTPLEFETIKRDILFCKNVKTDDGKKINGVVLGLLHKDGTIDVERTQELIQLAAPMQVTFHRAFDGVADPFVALEKIIEAGAHCLLTSGQRANAYDGKVLLQQLVEKANGRIKIMPGAGVNAQNIVELVRTTRAETFHLSGKGLIKSPMTSVNPHLQLSKNGISENDYFETDVEKVSAVVGLMMSDK